MQTTFAGNQRHQNLIGCPEVIDPDRRIDHSLFGLGIGYVDAHLLATARLTRGTALRTRDKRLDAAAQRLSLAARVVN